MESTSNADDDDTHLRLPDEQHHQQHHDHQHQQQASSEWSEASSDVAPVSPRSPSYPLPDLSESSTPDSSGSQPRGAVSRRRVFNLPPALDAGAHLYRHAPRYNHATRTLTTTTSVAWLGKKSERSFVTQK